MLTRLKVSGFKNLLNVDVRFGPFTCIAGANAAGKSNLFDAIAFLSSLADRPLLDAALSVRTEGGRTTDLKDIFYRFGSRAKTEMEFSAEMIVPKEARDDLGQKAEASITFLRYNLKLGYRKETASGEEGLEILHEELVHISQGDAAKQLPFPHDAKKWRRNAVIGARRGGHFISTEHESEGSHKSVIRLHQDRSAGRPSPRLASTLPRTVLSVVNAAESPTALLARREMQSWRLLQLEPSSLRKPDEFTAPTRLSPDGAHLPATLYHLAKNLSRDTEMSGGAMSMEAAYAQIANRLTELIDDVREVRIDRDERRELLTLMIRGRDGTILPARALSDGTLRFLALAVLELDPNAQGVLCLEEPENGIHPERIPAMLRLLRDIAVDVTETVGPSNPLRQVLINTHSPAVVAQVPDDTLLVAVPDQQLIDGERCSTVRFAALPETWRIPKSVPIDDVLPIPRGRLLAYLNPVLNTPDEDEETKMQSKRNGKTYKRRRVIDRPDLQPYLPFARSQESA